MSNINFTFEPEEMMYGDENLQKTKTCKTLAAGDYKGIQFKIVNTCGTHPCGYINVPATYGLNEEKYNFYPHGGITFIEFVSHGHGLDLPKIKNNLWLGWDFAHLGDYTSYSNGHKWTTEEILEDMKEAIDGYIGYIGEGGK